MALENQSPTMAAEVWGEVFEDGCQDVTMSQHLWDYSDFPDVQHDLAIPKSDG